MIFAEHWTDRIGLLNFSYRKQLEKAEELALKKFKTETGYDGEIVNRSGYNHVWYSKKICVEHVRPDRMRLCHEYAIEIL